MANMKQNQQQAYTTPASSPARRSDGINLRSGGVVTRNPNMRVLSAKTSRVEKPAPKKKKSKAVQRAKTLERPLSQCTELSELPMIDIDAYVNRSAEERRREIEIGKTPGKIKRPMNAFMLYRKAYQNRTKEMSSHNNHQIVSQICGESWPMEPQEVRDQFSEWAKLERENHQKAHPGYKFTPAKPKTAKKKAEEFDDDGSDLEGYNHITGRVGSRSRSNRSTPAPEGNYRYLDRSQSPHVYYPPHNQQYYGVPMMPQNQNVSSYQHSNPGKPLPIPYDPRPTDQHHYMQSSIQNTQSGQLRHMPDVQDVIYRNTPSPSNAYHQQQHHQNQQHFDVMMEQHHMMPPPQYAHPQQQQHHQQQVHPQYQQQYEQQYVPQYEQHQQQPQADYAPQLQHHQQQQSQHYQQPMIEHTPQVAPQHQSQHYQQPVLEQAPQEAPQPAYEEAQQDPTLMPSGAQLDSMNPLSLEKYSLAESIKYTLTDSHGQVDPENDPDLFGTDEMHSKWYEDNQQKEAVLRGDEGVWAINTTSSDLEGFLDPTLTTITP